jgi:hypothetical protein
MAIRNPPAEVEHGPLGWSNERVLHLIERATPLGFAQCQRTLSNCLPLEFVQNLMSKLALINSRYPCACGPPRSR